MCNTNEIVNLFINWINSLAEKMPYSGNHPLLSGNVTHNVPNFGTLSSVEAIQCHFVITLVMSMFFFLKVNNMQNLNQIISMQHQCNVQTYSSFTVDFTVLI